MFANVYGEEGITKALTLLKREVAIDAGNLGVPDLKKINPSYVSIFHITCYLSLTWAPKTGD